MLAKLAWRNVARNRRRSAITILSIAVGLAALTFVWAFIDGMNRQMIQNSTRFLAGDVQVHLKGYHDDPTLDLTMAEAQPVLAAVRNDPNVEAATVRLEGKALASRSDKSRGITLVGVDPGNEGRVSVLFNAVVSGTVLSDSTPGVLIGEQLAQALGLAEGDDLLLVGQAYDGSLASGRFPVRGVFRTRIDELDGRVAVLPLAVVRDFFAAPSGASAIAMRLRDRDQLDATQARLTQRLGPGYEVLSWPRLLPLVVVSTRFHEVMAWVVLVVFFGIVAAAVANPVLMAVLERTREFGIMLALGISRARLLGLVLLEAMMLGGLGLLAGNLLGLAVTAFFARTGIDLGAFGAALRTMPGLEDVIYPVIRLERSAMVSLAVFATACLTALYPAAKAALLEPVTAIRGLAGPRHVSGHGTPASSSHWPVFMVIAGRNILRNPRRTAITAGGTAFGIVAFVFLFSYFDGFGEDLIENSTRYVTGHVQLERAGFRQDYAPELAFEDAEALLQQLRAVPEVEAAAPRVQVQALASSAAKSEGILLTGIVPEAERGVTFIHRTIVEGNPLAAGADRDILIGRKLAERLGVRLGEKVIVMAQAASGELGTAAYRIGGIFATESGSFDSAMAFVTLRAAQSQLALGSRVSTINLRLRDRAALAGRLTDLRQRVAASGLSFQPWQELLPQLEEMVRMIRIISHILLAIAFVVIAMAIMNTVFMAVTERTREFGVMMALGTPPAAIQRMVVYETLVLMLLASFIGYGISALLVAYFGRQGIDLSGFFRGYSAIPGLTGVVHPKLVASHIGVPGLVLFVASVLVSLYPAARAARLDPVQAIRHA
ncbi:MAG: ABC transporter permease [Rhodoferax sp.]|uniref:ABC transporter permease n=1 Tax=Rhodoferax sp. TaxID=50421 RepID=UPI002717214B|nr:ABC transporter permease [Rhodoferax sp.]MDO8450826.1 ABC transporter permease [Rhodoferax sp.]